MAESLQDVVLVNGHPTDAEESKNGSKPHVTPELHELRDADPDPQAMVIQSLRAQVQDLFSQVTQLNNKLVKSYDRVSDLEDNLHVARSTIRSSTLRIAELEIERTQHLSALNTGLLVEKSNVTAELTRLMEKATEEAAQRGQAESARQAIEKELEDLSASLFSQANSMVAEARYARALSERKVGDAEQALKGAEEAVATMQQQVQLLQQQREESDKQVEEMKLVVGKGKWVSRDPQPSPSALPLRLRSSHQPYQEFLLFVAHLRSLHTSSPTPPAMSALLNLPFLARLLTEESEPTVRLDLAPSLNWLSRRSVLSAIHNGQVDIEPLSLTTLFSELPSSSHTNSTPIIPGITNIHANVYCALCGALVFSHPDSHSPSSQSRSSSHLSLSRSWSGNSSPWAASNLFKNPLSYSTALPGSSIPSPKSRPPTKASCQPLPETVYIFRLSVPVSASTQAAPGPVSLPLFNSYPSSSSQAPPLPARSDHSRNSSQTRSQPTIYPLCTSGWCLTRLRTTCSLWAFVRTGIVDKVWEEDVPVFPPVPVRSNTKEKEVGKDAGTAPPLPPRKKGLWGIASAFGERAASWGDGDKERDQAKEKVKEIVKVLPPPPMHPASQTAAKNSPPPLPKRDQGRRVQPPGATSAEDANTTSSQPPSPQPQVNDSDARDTKASKKDVDHLDSKDSILSAKDTPAAAFEPEPEAFSTPTEKIPAFPITSDAPTTEVLADGNTPAVVSVPTSRSATPSPAQPPAASVNGTARSASPAAPPLPRRAAARGPRPMSSRRVPEPPVPPSGSAKSDAEPANISIPAAPENVAKTLTGIAAKPADEAATVTPNGRQHTTEPQPENTELSRDTESVPVVSPSMNSGNEAEPQTSVSVESNQASDSSSSILESTSVTPGVHKKTVIESQQTQEPNREEVQESKANSEDGEAYVGDATWEERTWKEVVRLREEMFWARVGGLR